MSKMELGLCFTTSGMIVLKISTFLFTASCLLSSSDPAPDPAVIITTFESHEVSYSRFFKKEVSRSNNLVGVALLLRNHIST